MSADGASARYLLRLYITGSTPRSIRAVENLRRICERYMPERYDIEIIDIYADPEAARAGQVIAAPTLVRVQPEPLRRVIGDLADEDRVVLGLDLPAP